MGIIVKRGKIEGEYRAGREGSIPGKRPRNNITAAK